MGVGEGCVEIAAAGVEIGSGLAESGVVQCVGEGTKVRGAERKFVSGGCRFGAQNRVLPLLYAHAVVELADAYPLAFPLKACVAASKPTAVYERGRICRTYFSFGLVPNQPWSIGTIWPEKPAEQRLFRELIAGFEKSFFEHLVCAAAVWRVAESGLYTRATARVARSGDAIP